MVGSINDWQKERQFQVLNDKKEERGVRVIRSNVEKIIDIKVRFLSSAKNPRVCLLFILHRRTW